MTGSNKDTPSPGSIVVGDGGTIQSVTDTLGGQSKKGRIARILPFLGPAFIASVAYMDPGNFATNIARAAPSSATCCCGSSSPAT